MTHGQGLVTSERDFLDADEALRVAGITTSIR
jgi:hypothetical protein